MRGRTLAAVLHLPILGATAIAVAVALLVLLFAGASALTSAQARAATDVHLVSLHSGKCLEIYGFSQSNFATANQWGCWGGPNQTLRVTPLPDGFFELRFEHSNKCLEVINWSTASGAAVGQWACHGGDNQRWAGRFASDETFVIQNKFSGKCLDVFEARFGDGAPAIQWDCHFGPNQLWRTEATAAAATDLDAASQGCLSDGSVSVRFEWEPSNSGSQWIDLSLTNNGFAGGTFTGLGPLPSESDHFEWNSLQPGRRHYVRVNTATAAGWRPSATLAFDTRSDCSGTPPAKVVRKLGTSQKVVALTFDAGADAGYTEMILDTLEENGVTAAFGVTGEWVEEHPDLVERIAGDGHNLINHSYDHQSFTGASTGEDPLTFDQRSLQLSRTEDVVQVLTGESTKPYFRPPFGDYDASVNADVGVLGYKYNVMWSLDSYGWRGITEDEIVERVTSRVEPGSIVIFHVGSASQDGPALQAIIDELREMGYDFAPLDEYYP